MGKAAVGVVCTCRVPRHCSQVIFVVISALLLALSDHLVFSLGSFLPPNECGIVEETCAVGRLSSSSILPYILWFICTLYNLSPFIASY